MTLSQRARRTRETSFGWQIQRIASVVNSRMDAALGAQDLSLPQFAVMMTVLEHERLTQAEIGAEFAMPAYAISRAIDHLEAKGLLRRTPHPTSRRAHLIEATPAGLDTAPALFALIDDVNDSLKGGLSAEEQAQLQALLPKLLASLQR